MAITYSLVPEELGLHDPLLIGAFTGWPDAALGASGAVRFLVESLSAAPLATWDGDEYYDFVELRPVSRVVPPRDRILVWPQGEFWVAREVPLSGASGSPGGEESDPGEAGGEAGRRRSLLLFLAHEPRLRWRAYGRELVAFARRCGVQQATFFGAAYADVPHTRAPVVTGWATESRLRTRLEALGIPFSAYQGPSSMQSAAIEACREAGIACASLFSNGPSYLTIPNANLSLALLRRLVALFQLDLDLRLLDDAAAALTRQVSEAIEERSNAEFRDHLRRLEARFDAQAAPLAPGEVRRQLARQEEQEEAAGPLNVDPQDVVRELEDFLRRRNQRLRQGDAGGEDAPPTPPDEGQEADDAGGGEETPPDAPPGSGGRP
jgi:PAC2 family